MNKIAGYTDHWDQPKTFSRLIVADLGTQSKKEIPARSLEENDSHPYVSGPAFARDIHARIMDVPWRRRCSSPNRNGQMEIRQWKLETEETAGKR